MRIDDIAYQRATRVAAFGLFLQFVIGLALLVFGILAPDTTFVFAAYYVMGGIPLWLALVIVFNQHKLERIESLEADQLQSQRLSGTGSAFDSESEEFNVSARRLRLMHKWMMPLVTWFIIIGLVLAAVLNLLWLRELDDAVSIGESESTFEWVSEGARGWALAICLAVAAISFICSRFISGMSKQPAWQNLRGGAGYMVGNALVMLAAAVGIIFLYFDNTAVMRGIAQAILIFMLVVAGEFVLNFLLNLYRPRRAGEVPRPAFDSRLLSLLSAPDSIVRSINEAVNYQFGFDITSSWGYQLLLRAVWKLAAFAIIVIVALNCIVIVEPYQQAIRLRGGEIVNNEVHDSGLLLKWPWPIESAEVYDVARVRVLPVTNLLNDNPSQRDDPIYWNEEIPESANIEPFIVSTTPPTSPSVSSVGRTANDEDVLLDEDGEELNESDQQAQQVSKQFALVQAEFLLHYRIREDGGLIKFLSFAANERIRRQRLRMREKAIQVIATREISKYLSKQDLDRVISEDRTEMVEDLQDLIQKALDSPENDAGVEVLAVVNPWIRPAGAAAEKFEELSFNIAQRERRLAEAERSREAALTLTAGNSERARELIDMMDAIKVQRDNGATEEEMAEAMRELETALTEAGGEAATIITNARADLWTNVLLAEARVERFQGRLAPWKAGSEIYREYLLMQAISDIVSDGRKYFIGVDPSIMEFDIEMLQDDSAFNFEEMLEQAGDNGQ